MWHAIFDRCLFQVSFAIQWFRKLGERVAGNKPIPAALVTLSKLSASEQQYQMLSQAAQVFHLSQAAQQAQAVAHDVTHARRAKPRKGLKERLHLKHRESCRFAGLMTIVPSLYYDHDEDQALDD